MELKKRKEHYKTYNRKQAVDMLYEDDRVFYIEEKEFLIRIETNPIKLSPNSKMWSKLTPYSIGRFIIEIEEDVDDYGREKLSVSIVRKDGGMKFIGRDIIWQTHHICDYWPRKICWGNMEEQVEKLAENKDWYWLGKLSLEMISDSKPEDGMWSLFKKCILYGQYQYALEKRNKKHISHLRKLFYEELGIRIAYYFDGDKKKW